MADTFANNEENCCNTCSNDGVSKNNPTRVQSNILRYWRPISSLILLLSGLMMDLLVNVFWFTDTIRFFWYLTAYLPVALPVLKQAVIHLRKGEVFTEFFLMGIATLGAFYIGEYPEGVGVMLFYAVGEAFQQGAVHRARQNIQSLLDVRSETTHLKHGNSYTTVHPQSVNTGEIIQIKPGERVPLDGKLLTEQSSFDTSAISGESKPRSLAKGEEVLAGMINLNCVIEMEVTKSYDNSSISRILKMVQDAASRKAKTEIFIRSFARIYTPAVVLLATLIVLLPSFFVTPYVFEDWLYRGLVFLVISCPCALVISIPLSYFGGIGAASRNGILVKGSNYLDALKSVETVVVDKTGTLTKGVFKVKDIQLTNGADDEILPIVYAVQNGSTHPIAKAITGRFEGQFDSTPSVEQQREIPGLGIQARVSGKEVLIGNQQLLEREQVPFNGLPVNDSDTVVHLSVEREYKGYIVISDEIKKDAKNAIEKLRKVGVNEVIMLSGDKASIVNQVAKQLKIDRVYSELLPEEKAYKLEEIKSGKSEVVAYAGDGINDAPVLALSDIGIAMGAMGSDAAVETADVVIQTDQPSKISTAIQIARSTRNIVWQNISLAMGVKLLFLGMGALGVATLWEAVFADVGVALLAILNAIRIQKMNFD